MQLVLLIEDDRDIREATLEFLEMENFEGLGFPSGVQALDYLNDPANRLPALIITDMNMPQMDGPTFRAAQLSTGRIKHIPCVVLSADLRVEAKFQNLYLAGTVKKPIDLDQLASVVRQAIAASSGPPAVASERAFVVPTPTSATEANVDLALHDVLNDIGAAKMHTEILLGTQGLPEDVFQRLGRIEEKLSAAIQILRNGDATPVAPAAVSASALGHKKVLLVDDSADLRSLFTTYLKRRGFNVFAAADANEALAIIRHEGLPALLLVDKHLGAVSASDIVDKIEDVYPELRANSKAVLLTSDETGVSDTRFIAKEFKAQDLKSLEKIVTKYLA